MVFNVYVTQFDCTGNRKLADMSREGLDIEDNSKNASYALRLGYEQVHPSCVGDVEVREVLAVLRDGRGQGRAAQDPPGQLLRQQVRPRRPRLEARPRAEVRSQDDPSLGREPRGQVDQRAPPRPRSPGRSRIGDAVHHRPRHPGLIPASQRSRLAIRKV